jgi:hypothetical protein
VDPAYVSLAEESGGNVLLFEPSEIGGAAVDMSATNQHDETVFRAGGRVAEGIYEFEVPVDSTIQSVYFFVSLQCLDSEALIAPSGDQIHATSTGVAYHEFKAIRLYTVQAPSPGVWRIRMAGRGLLSVIVRAETDLALDDVRLSDDAVRRLEVSVAGEAQGVSVQLVSSDASTVERLDLRNEEREFGRVYTGEVAPTLHTFRVAVTGTDANGFPFQRVSDRLYTAPR